MADPAVQFQPVQAQYGFQGHVYNPPSVNVPSDTGRILAGIGGQLGEMAGRLQNSPLVNPAVRAQMQLDVANAHAGLAHIDMLNKSGLGPFTMGIDANNRAYSVPVSQIQNPTIQGAVSRYFNKGQQVYPSTGGDGSGTDGTQQPQQQPQPQQQQQPQQQPQQPPTTGEMGKTTQVAPSNMFASTSRVAPPPYGGWDSEGEGAGGGGMAGGGNYFLNPATGNYEPVQQQQAPLQQAAQQPQQAQAQPGGMMDQYARDYAAGHAQGQAARQQQDLQNWQQQTIHPVVGAQDALDWFRKNRTTLAQDATYLDNGGPGGQPAYAFHMKGGGTNIVPVAQMVKAGFGPTIAANNTSVALSQTDQLQQQQQNALGAPPPMTAGAPPAPAAPQAGTQGGPPPAPGAPPAQPPPQQGAPATGYNQAAYQMPQGATITQAGDVNPALMAGGSDQAALAASKALAAQQSGSQPQYGDDSRVTTQAPNITQQQQAQVAAAEKNKDVGNTFTDDTGFTWNRDTNPGTKEHPNKYYGRMYASLPGTAGNYYDEQRFYPGTEGYKLYEQPESAVRQQMVDKWVNTGFLTRAEADALTPQQIKPWLQRAWQNEHLTNAPIDQGTNLTLDAAEQSHKNIVQIKDMLQTLANNGYANLGTADRIAASAENAGNTLTTNRQGLIYDVGRSVGGTLKQSAEPGMNADAAAVIRNLDQKTQEEQELLKQHPGLLINPGKGGGQETPNIGGFEVANIPQSTILNDAAFSGQDIKTKFKTLDALQSTLDTRYNSIVNGQHDMLQRVQPKHDVNSLKAVQGQEIDDSGNLYRDHKYPSSISPQEAIAKASSATTDQFPTVTAQDLSTFKVNHPGAYFYDENHNLLRVKPRK